MTSGPGLTDWRTQWIKRSLPSLNVGSVLVVYVLALAALALGISTVVRLRRCRREIKANPSSRAAIFAACEKDVTKSSKRQFKIALLFTTLASFLWASDAVVGGLQVYEDVANQGTRYPAGFWLDLAIHLVGITAILIFSMFAVPLVQVVWFSLWMQGRCEATSNTALAAIVPEARMLSTHFMQLWSLSYFLLLAFWPPTSTHYVIRAALLQGIVGSVNAWSHLSFALNWRAERLETVEFMEALSARAVAVKCITEVKVLYTEKESTSLLPQQGQML